jgi:hypothetical protein
LSGFAALRLAAHFPRKSIIQINKNAAEIIPFSPRFPR